MGELSTIGIWLLLGGVVVIVIEMVVAGIWTARVAKRSRQLNERIATETGLIQEDLARLKAALEETRRLWQPFRRVLRWVRHPLAVAFMQSYARRRAQ
jgi:hypothetical protein